MSPWGDAGNRAGWTAVWCRLGHGALPAHLTQVRRLPNVGAPIPGAVLVMGAVDPTGGPWRQVLWLALLVAALVAVARYHPIRRVEVVGSSMVPALLPGDRLVVVRFPWRSPLRPRAGHVVALRDPRRSDRILIKRVRAVDPARGTIEVEGDAREFSTDSRSFGPVPGSAVVGRALYRYAPAGRNGAVPGSGEYHRA